MLMPRAVWDPVDCRASGKEPIMEMSNVSQCKVTDCSYNDNQECHAYAITVGGDEEHPQCDTFIHATGKGGDPGITAGVGACKVVDCRFNDSLECDAREIDVLYKGSEPDCGTFQPRQT
jgi:hypothetical protein